MANNQIPINVKNHRIGWATSGVNTTNTTTDLTSGTIYEIFTASGVDDSWLRYIKFRTLGTNVATVARIWINNGGVTTNADNNVLFTEITLPASTISQNFAQVDITAALNFGIPSGYKVFVTLGTTVAAGYDVTLIGGDY